MLSGCRKKKDNEMEKTCFHFTRVRRKGDSTYYDPQSDIRLIFPNVMQMSMSYVLDKYQGTEYEQASLHLYTCMRILQIRLEEDPLPMDAQLGEFLKAIGDVPKEVLNLWFGMVATSMTLVYALFMRRDAATDKQALASMLEYTRLSSYRDSLQQGTYEQMKKELQAASPLLVDNTTRDGLVVCPETGEELERVKDIARMFICVTGDKSWNALADACDEAFNSSRPKTKEQAVALALAYPTYSHPCLSVEDSGDDGSEDKADQAADER